MATIPVTPRENGCDCYGTFSRDHNPSRGCPVHDGEAYLTALESAREAYRVAHADCAARRIDWRAETMRLRADRDRLAAEVERLKTERDEAKQKVARYKQAVADQLHADMVEIVGQRDAAEQRTAEVIAAWLDKQYSSIGIHGRIAQNIRAGMWRKEATK